MDLTVTLLHLAAYVFLALGLAFPHLRRLAVAVLAAAVLLSLIAAALHLDVRELTTVHHYAGFAGSQLEVSMVPFPTGTVTAPGWQWPLPFVGFAALWILTLRQLGSRLPKSPLLLPLLFAWTATATWLGMQELAAPVMLVQPAGIDRFLWPAGLALALLAARAASGILPLIVMTSASIVAARLPAAMFSKLASDQHWGTSLDISSIRDIVNPLTQLPFDPRLAAGSSEQQFWLIWLEHVLIYPALHSLSLFGIALGVHLWHKHSDNETYAA